MSDAESDAPAIACSPCRGTGRVVSNLGGSPHEQECPWCEGGGVLLPEHDAQGAGAAARAAEPA